MGRVKNRPISLWLDNVTAVLASYQPELRASRKGTEILILGRYQLHDESAVVLTKAPISTYDVEIWLATDFPKTEPWVFEVGRRIPRDLDRHMFSNGRCCVTVWEAWLATAPQVSFEAFLTGPVHEFFLSQFWYELNGEWPFGEWSHGLEGLREAYAEIFENPRDGTRLRAYLEVLSRERPKGHWPCPCGSGRRLRNCHRERVIALHHRIPPPLATRMLHRVSRPGRTLQVR